MTVKLLPARRPERRDGRLPAQHHRHRRRQGVEASAAGRASPGPVGGLWRCPGSLHRRPCRGGSDATVNLRRPRQPYGVTRWR